MMLRKLCADPESTRLYMSTLCNGQACSIETRNTCVGGESNFYRIGVEIRARGDGNFIFETWTIESGNHVLNSQAIVSDSGLLIQGCNSRVNCFALGWVKADQAWISALLEELEKDLVTRKRTWDIVE